MIPLFGELEADGRRDVLEGRLVYLAVDDAELTSPARQPPPVGYATWRSWASERWPTSIEKSISPD